MNTVTKRTWMRVLSLMLCAVMVLAVPFAANATNFACIAFSGTNVNGQEYNGDYATTIQSFLTGTANGFMRLQADMNPGLYIAEYYDSSYRLLDTVLVEQELSIFGGFYASGTHYYILTGQKNPEESADVECYRITKYDLNWNRLGSVGVYDCLAYNPFHGGSARMTMCGSQLLVRTCQTMYITPDQLRHQTNLTFQVDTESMTVTDLVNYHSSDHFGYVSHSFNQFIRTEDNKVVAVDHGDAFPRSIVLMRYPTDVTTGKFSANPFLNTKKTDILTFPGSGGENYTGASVGGFEYSSSAYLIAYNSVAQDDNYFMNTTRNIFVGVVDKATNQLTTKQFTHYAEGDGTTSNPHFVKVSEDAFLLLWSRDADVYFARLDGNGNLVGTVQTMKNAALSDCAPIVADGKVIWYTWHYDKNTFYEINAADLTQARAVVLQRGHDYEAVAYPEKPGGNATITCTRCGHSRTVPTGTRMTIFWQDNSGTNVYAPQPDDRYHVGQTVRLLLRDYPSALDPNDKLITCSDPTAMTVTHEYDSSDLTFHKAGVFDVTVAYRYCPDVSYTYTITVDHLDADGNGRCDDCGMVLGLCDVADYRGGGTYTHPEKEGYVFAGWYTDPEFTQPLDQDVTTGQAYAKFVPEKVLSVKWQVSAGTNANTPSTTLRLVTTVDSLDYSRVGFRFQIDGGKWNTRSSTTVYSQIKSNTDGVVFNYKPTVFNESSRFFLTRTVTGVPKAYYDAVWSVIPYWVTLDGTEVDGVIRMFRISDFYNR